VKNFENKQAAFSFENTVESKRPMRVEFDFGRGFQTLNFAPTADANKYQSSEHNVFLNVTPDMNGFPSFNLSSTGDFKYRFIFESKNKKLENSQQRFFAIYTDELTQYDVGDEDGGDRSIKWAGVDFNYHLFALYFDKEASLIYKNSTDGTFSMYSNKPEKTLGYHLVFVKKEYNYLNSLGHQLKASVNFGIWGFFAVWILKGLQFFYTFIPNYGVSIILLTLLIRLITFPLQYKSFVSMKKLQIIQPELTKIREKHKEDPQRLQKESMELFKRSGANPVGGCLPLLLQMPVFFAFYKVLYSAVELVDAPFMLWLNDLSNKDPFYVLPVLMTGAMFLQQKITPNTISDPVQKKVMLFMPLIFGFIMKDLPSGLSLYICVSTIFGILQQLMVFNAKGSEKPVVV
jgi:YidC/Oxa1 family membrane protein insertase